ncbi:MAG TPA: hypothetical protein PKN36_06130, partial [bacterium]|nr:hypothetical protein [bacterium]
GFQGEHYFKAGEWTHIAYTWDVREGKANMEGNLSIFINGNKLPFKWVAYGLNELQKSKNFKLSDDGKEVTLGPFDGTMDILRISDIVRYRENFVPSKTAPDIDANTRTLFLFDGTLKGISASNQPVEAK